jgi:hypothetical protein
VLEAWLGLEVGTELLRAKKAGLYIFPTVVFPLKYNFIGFTSENTELTTDVPGSSLKDE